MKRILSILIASAVLTSCQKQGISESKAPVSKSSIAQVESELLGAAHFQGFPENLQVELGQSPINIPVSKTVKISTIDPQKHYESFPLTEVLNTGENLKVVVTGNNYITVAGKVYTLKQFHFHRGSEHAINGRKGMMEVHLVHIADDNTIAVLGVMLQPGGINKSVETLLKASPEEEGSASVEAAFNPSVFFPNNDNQYYSYSGSLTTNPFTTGLTWIVYKHSINVSASQVAKYEDLYPEENARPLQEVGGRVIYENVVSK